MKILIFDNYDSFTYNLVHLVEKIIHDKVEVHRNDQIDIGKVDEYDKIVISPGPGLPKESGILPELIRRYAGQKSILGVCLGHQAIGEAFGGSLTNLSKVYHGVATKLILMNDRSFAKNDIMKNIPDGSEAGRYHSWIVDRQNFPESLEITAEDDNGFVMAMRHKEFDLQGVQFHPESVLTPLGEQMLRNWLGN